MQCFVDELIQTYLEGLQFDLPHTRFCHPVECFSDSSDFITAGSLAEITAHDRFDDMKGCSQGCSGRCWLPPSKTPVPEMGRTKFCPTPNEILFLTSRLQLEKPQVIRYLRVGMTLAV